MIFQNSLIKSLIYKIKKIKISRIFLHVQIDEIQNKMSKIKKQIVNSKILKKKLKKSLIKSLTLPIKHHKKFDNFWTS